MVLLFLNIKFLSILSNSSNNTNLKVATNNVNEVFAYNNFKELKS